MRCVPSRGVRSSRRRRQRTPACTSASALPLVRRLCATAVCHEPFQNSSGKRNESISATAPVPTARFAGVARRGCRPRSPGRPRCRRRSGSKSAKTRGDFGKEAGRRGAAGRHCAQARALCPPHRYLESAPRPQGGASAHARARAASPRPRLLTIGYSFVLLRSGRLYEGRGPRALPAAQGGHNSGTIAIACVYGAFWRPGLAPAQAIARTKAE
jgi:hypothetical protein